MVLRKLSWRSYWQWVLALAISSALVGCGSMPKSTTEATGQQATVAPSIAKNVPVLPPAGSGRGGYYLDDGPGDHIPEGLYDLPDAEPKVEPYARGPNKPYSVFGQTYTPITDNRHYKQRGYGSWYGKKFHGKKTSSGEPYDMYKMTAAHPTLPIPCYARVTNLGNGKQVIVRVNDRGPFRSARIIDLSYTAALKLGYLGKGSGLLEVEHLLPHEIERLARNKREGSAALAMQHGTVEREMPASAGEKSGEAVSQKDDFLDKFLIQGKNAEEPTQAGTAKNYYLQLGVFRQSGNAQSLQAKYASAWRNEKFEVVTSGEVYKLYAGPFVTREMAMDAARRFLKDQNLKTLVVQR